VTICNFNLWPEQDERGRFTVPMLSRWRMQEQHSGERGLPQVQYAFLELPKYAAGDAPQTLIDRWSYFFREATHLSEIPSALAEERGPEIAMGRSGGSPCGRGERARARAGGRRPGEGSP
jgi:hypothetical protein